MGKVVVSGVDEVAACFNQEVVVRVRQLYGGLRSHACGQIVAVSLGFFRYAVDDAGKFGRRHVRTEKRIQRFVRQVVAE